MKGERKRYIKIGRERKSDRKRDECDIRRERERENKGIEGEKERERERESER
jgi:hypothetical protein